jgi:hypothetical protein
MSPCCRSGCGYGDCVEGRARAGRTAAAGRGRTIRPRRTAGGDRPPVRVTTTAVRKWHKRWLADGCGWVAYKGQPGYPRLLDEQQRSELVECSPWPKGIRVRRRLDPRSSGHRDPRRFAVVYRYPSAWRPCCTGLDSASRNRPAALSNTFVQNLRRGHYEVAIDARSTTRVAAFTDSPKRSDHGRRPGSACSTNPATQRHRLLRGSQGMAGNAS